MPNPEISQITLPSGTTYDIKDTVARNAMAARFSYTISTSAATTPYGITWTSGNTVITGTLAASADTAYSIYLVPSSRGDENLYEEYIAVNTTGTSYVWESIGNTGTDLSGLGSLATKNSVTATLPAITRTTDVELNSTTKYVASSATGGGSVSAGTAASCTLPTWSATVSNENLTIAWTNGSWTANTPTAVTLPSFASQTIATSVKTQPVHDYGNTNSSKTITAS